MRYTFCFLFCIFFLTNNCLAQSKQKRIPGTKIIVELPEGYSLSRGECGFEKPADNKVVFEYHPGENVYAQFANYQPNAMSKFGIITDMYLDTIVSGYDALLFTLPSKQDNKESLLLFLGDSTFYEVVYGNYDKSDEIRNAIIQALLTSKYEQALALDPFENTLFTWDTLNTGYKFLEKKGSIYYFKKFYSDRPEEMAVTNIGTKTSRPGTPMEYEAQNFIHYQESYGFTDFKMTDSQSSTEGETEYLIKTGNCAFNEKRISFFQKVIRRGNNLIMVYGYADPDDPEALDVIRKFAEKVDFVG